ncbi:phosphoenolpyruvate synthase [Solemya velum gill symbiont]|uniref:Phosphoenolpyruvate synthase n=2 Tax=Solemya velum gill symbiont TaxID=2340 RepID=A0A1T2HUF5_SOVGS|nr:phosphoenolpyruvate synthase [Solemya velum gill symbiont]OOY35341.1 phosphoenolpyruvate synthase [Solemya velum gill symbiont]OOY38068.1 phosphoenolpyruvate synthase [Solemya velum gill symbiont]OOY41067.1 phosphoenolpyruvate synthase [Solemya velum gill symbiont]OOY48058.1 phosphoenolpyruvate synthase [Solemya velum gill symbiont]OOY48180.1 phosphoenolpyruvate synthase [Solemya velum gill symbiont]
MIEYLIPLDQLGMDDVDRVGGKNASLGEMIQNLSDLDVKVPGGFATTADAYRAFIAHDGLGDRINQRLAELDIEDVAALQVAGAEIREWIAGIPFPQEMEEAIDAAYAALEEEYGTETSWAVRSSATAEDLPEASFAGQQETYLNVRGIEEIKNDIRLVFSSLFNDRAISYRVHQGFAHEDVALSAGIQKMVRSDIGSSGVMFTVDTESGFEDVVFITSSYGLGEMVVQGAVNPDEFYVYKPAQRAGRPAVVRRSLGGKAIKMIYSDQPGEKVTTVPVDPDEQMLFSLDDEHVNQLAGYADAIEKHYGRPMDVEWALDGIDNQLYIVQARPETVQSRVGQVIERFSLMERGDVLAEGRSIGQKIGAGRARILSGLDEMDKVQEGDVLITDMTDPDWEPVMKRAAAIVTNRGGRTCHAAIIAREMGVPAVVGCGNATEQVEDGTDVTVSCAEGETGHIYAGKLNFDINRIELGSMPEAPLKIMMNVGNPERAFSFAGLPNFGVGLARLEFIINNMIGVHPRALLEYDSIPASLREQIAPLIAAYGDPVDFYVKRIIEGISTIGSAFAPNPVIVRLSDFKSNEYANLIGGDHYEPHEENPMIGYRGTSRYLSDEFEKCFELECRALKYVRDEMGLDNVWVMVPFVRTLQEAEGVVSLLDKYGLRRGENGLKLIMMCEVPSNAILAEQFLEYFDGFSIGSNDMTQLTLAIDRDSGLVSKLFDERDEAVKFMLSRAIRACRDAGKYVGICGQGPSDHPDFAKWLVDEGIESVSLNPDTVISTWLYLAGVEEA